MTLFSVYRILKCLYKPKLSTITDSYKGTGHNDILQTASVWTPFSHLEIWKKEPKQIRDDISPKELYRFNTASPSGKISFLTLIPDSGLLVSSGMITHIESYLNLFKVGKPTFSNISYNSSLNFSSKLKRALSLFERSKGLSLRFKSRDLLGKLAFKKEAGGKLRVFAMVDGWTQSLLKPLHQFLFEVLKQIPNDSTFNQVRGKTRLTTLVKSFKLTKIYSFDLSSATDRLPIDLQAVILSKLSKIPELGSI